MGAKTFLSNTENIFYLFWSNIFEDEIYESPYLFSF